MASAESNDERLSAAEAQPFRLLDLPPELWSRICKSAVVHNEPLVINAYFGRDAFHDFYTIGEDGYGVDLPEARMQQLRKSLAPPAITTVCRAIRAESLSAFYRENMFIGWSNGNSFFRMRSWWIQLPRTHAIVLKRFYYLHGPGGLRPVHEDWGGRSSFRGATVLELGEAEKAEVFSVVQAMQEWKYMHTKAGEREVWQIVPKAGRAE